MEFRRGEASGNQPPRRRSFDTARPRPTSEQLKEIHAVGSQVRPWLHYYLASDAGLMQQPEARQMLIRINTEFDKQVRNHPNQHVSYLVANSILSAREYIEDNPAANPRQQAARSKAIDTIE